MADEKIISKTQDKPAQEAWLMSVARVIVKPIYFALFRPRVLGRDNFKNLPKNKPIIFIGNHIHQFDAAALGVLTPRNPHFLAKIELSRNKWVGWALRSMGLVFVDRDERNQGVKEAIQQLSQGKTIAIFPEGTAKLEYKKPNELLPFKFGAAKMAMTTNATIVPVAISGKYKFWARPKISFGTPFKLDKKHTLEKNNERLRDEVLKLMKLSGVENPRKIAGKPARNPSKAPPVLDN